MSECRAVSGRCRSGVGAVSGLVSGYGVRAVSGRCRPVSGLSDSVAHVWPVSIQDTHSPHPGLGLWSSPGLGWRDWDCSPSRLAGTVVGLGLLLFSLVGTARHRGLRFARLSPTGTAVRTSSWGPRRTGDRGHGGGCSTAGCGAHQAVPGTRAGRAQGAYRVRIQNLGSWFGGTPADCFGALPREPRE